MYTTHIITWINKIECCDLETDRLTLAYIHVLATRGQTNENNKYLIPGLLPYNVTVVHAELTVFTMSADCRTWVTSHQKAEVTNNKNDVDLTQTYR